MKFSFILPSPAKFQNTAEFGRVMAAVAKLGYGAVEFQLGYASEVDTRALHTILDEEGLALSSFQTGAASMADECFYTSPDEKKRRTAIDKLHRFIDLAAEFGAIPVTGLMQGRRGEEPDGKMAYERIYAAMRETSEHAEKCGVTMVIEPCNKMEVGYDNTVARTLETVKEVNSPSLRTMVDTYHANIEEPSVEGALTECAPYMRHVHLSETNRGDFGTGHLDFVSLFGKLADLKYDGYCGVGVYFTEKDVLEKAGLAMEYVIAALRLSELKRAAGG